MASFFSEIEDQFSEYTWPRLIYSAVRVPAYHLYFEICLIIGIIWLLFKRSYNIHDKAKLSATEKEDLIKEWIPEPLVPASWTPPEKLLERFHRASVGPIRKYIQFEDKGGRVTAHLNVASLNFLDFIGDEKLNKVAIKALRTYGLGACGPRGFYGTFDVHLTLEKALESFLGVEEVALYSYAFSTIASAIPAYAKRTDLIFADEGVGQAIREGLRASRSTVHFFRHNDINHLEELMIAQEAEDSGDPSRASQIRRFLVVEGLYLDYGDICPLPRLIDLKYKYKVRIILDESISFGVLGKAGRGVTEHFGINVEHVDVITSSLETAIGVCGGFCAGSHFVVDHQRLSGQGYCFSASLPPMLAAAAQTAVEQLSVEDGVRQSQLRSLSHRLQAALMEASLAQFWRLESHSHPDSPVKHIRLAVGTNSIERLEHACDLAAALPRVDASELAKGELGSTPVLLTVARHADNTLRRIPEPSIRLALNCSMKTEELAHVCEVLRKVGEAMAVTKATSE
ncbi:Serine palmitoyltransferase 1 [Taenia crassiceps]|uniref:Serine palmitoyltransferase 1 n=1 Tax=Taenia crassiceps TaxID=6207 RepID=A0ABR4QIN0_9CEST